MCLAIPGKVLEITELGPLRSARVQFGGIVRQVSLNFVPEAGLGDYVMVHVGFAISKVDASEATPLFLSAAFIIEEGFPMRDLRRLVNSLRQAAADAGVQVITGDTKVVEKGKGDGLFINTTGIGLVPEGIELSADRARPGDKVLLSGSIGEHGIAILAQREGLEFETQIKSDSAALHTLVSRMIEVTRDIRGMRDPTRGGVSSTLNEIAESSQVGIEIEEASLPIREEVRGACELPGLDPLYVANEGKLIAIVASEAADAVLQAMKQHALGSEARVIGAVKKENPGLVTMRTPFGTTRIVDMLAGDQLPRICSGWHRLWHRWKHLGWRGTPGRI